jgi:F-box/leucine-rich repeat protein 2/20
MITHFTIQHLAHYCKPLKELDLTDCIGIDDVAFCHLSRIPNLSILNLSECQRISFKFDEIEEYNS